MLEKYNAKNLYEGEISGIVPYSIEKMGGGYSVDGNFLGTYKTILNFDGDKYVDIFWPDLIINVIDAPSDKNIMISDDGILYSLNSKSLEKCPDNINENDIIALAMKQKQNMSKKRLLKK